MSWSWLTPNVRQNLSSSRFSAVFLARSMLLHFKNTLGFWGSGPSAWTCCDSLVLLPCASMVGSGVWQTVQSRSSAKPPEMVCAPSRHVVSSETRAGGWSARTQGTSSHAPASAHRDTGRARDAVVVDAGRRMLAVGVGSGHPARITFARGRLKTAVQYQPSAVRLWSTERHAPRPKLRRARQTTRLGAHRSLALRCGPAGGGRAAGG